MEQGRGDQTILGRSRVELSGQNGVSPQSYLPAVLFPSHSVSYLSCNTTDLFQSHAVLRAVLCSQPHCITTELFALKYPSSPHSKLGIPVGVILVPMTTG